MNVYAFYPTPDYSNGVLLIAAENIRDARKLKNAHLSHDYLDSGVLMRGLAYVVYAGRYTFRKPRILIDAIHIE